MLLKFKVTRQTLTCENRSIKPKANSENYLHAQFTVPEDYDGTLTAHFGIYQGGAYVESPGITIPRDTMTVVVPPEVIKPGSLYVWIDSTGDKYIPTSREIVTIDPSGNSGVIPDTPDGQVNQYQEITEMYNVISETAPLVQENAEAAALSEENARTSELNAKASEEAAKESEDKARLSQDAAKQSEDNAEAYAQSAAGSADTATTKANEAAQSASDALDSKNAAAGSATTAGQQATIATNKAEEAAGYVAEVINAHNSAVKNKTFATLDERFEDIEADVDLATVDAKTGTFVQSTVADDCIAELKIEGATMVTKANPELDISPDNVAVITSAKDFEVGASGKNLLPNFASNKVTNGITFTVNPDKSITIKGTAVANAEIDIVGASYTSLYPVMYSSSKTYKVSGGFNSSIKLNGKTYENTYHLIMDATQGATWYNKNFERIYIQVMSGAVVDTTIYPQIEENTITPYEPYKSNKLTIPYELRKLLNGVADTIEHTGNGKGRWTQRSALAIFDGSADEGWIRTSNATYTRFSLPLPNSVQSDITHSLAICTHFKLLGQGGTAVSGNIGFVIISGNIIINNGTTMSDIEFKAWLAANPITVQYELATPIETIIDLPDLTTYKGTTNIYSTSNPQVTITATFKSRLANAYSVLMSEIIKIKQAIISMGGTV